MNQALWPSQVLWGPLFSVAGFASILGYQPEVWNRTLPQAAWFSALPQCLSTCSGVWKFLGGVGLILPAMAGVKPKLTPFAALGLTRVMILAAIFHVGRAQDNFLAMHLGLGGVAAFIACGRWFARPIAPASINILAG
jgi:DoxX-like family